MSGFTLYPAIDVRAGRVVRLRQGDYSQETRYANDPLAQAQQYAEAGATWLHLVDLDAAREGGYTLAPLLEQVKARTALSVQTGGGVRTAQDVRRMIDSGADRVVVGSLAVREPETVMAWLEDVGVERITVALDVRRIDGRWQLPTEGWTKQSGVEFEVLLQRYAEARLRHVLCTDIDRDGMLAGSNISLYRDVVALLPGLHLQASGGVRDIGDIEAAREAGCAGAVLGKALLEGRFDLAQALREELAC